MDAGVNHTDAKQSEEAQWKATDCARDEHGDYYCTLWGPDLFEVMLQAREKEDLKSSVELLISNLNNLQSLRAKLEEVTTERDKAIQDNLSNIDGVQKQLNEFEAENIELRAFINRE